MPCCEAFGCLNRTRSGSRPGSHVKKGVSFHRFPKDAARRAAWIAAIRRDKWQGPTTESRVCSEHFTDDDYKVFMDEMRPSHKLLQNGAIPSVFKAFPKYLQKKVTARKPPKERPFSPPKKRSTALPTDKSQFKQDPENSFVAQRNSSPSACTKSVSAKPTFQLPVSVDHPYSVLEPSSESDQNLEESLEPDFNPSDYIYPVDAECIVESATVAHSPTSPVKSSPVLTSSPSAKDSFKSSTPKWRDYSQKTSILNPVRDFVATNLHEIRSEFAKACSSCKLFKEANALLGNELEGKEQTISYLQEEVIRLRKQLELYKSKKLSVQIIRQ